VTHADKPPDSIGRRRDPPFLRTTLPCYSNPHVADNPLGENEADNAALQRICEVLRLAEPIPPVFLHDPGARPSHALRAC
jgi:hypothetical protein